MGRLLPLVVPPGPRNPLGRFWIGLSLAGIGVHGTPVPSSIRRVDVGTRGRIVYEPVQD
jgi:L,D-transpeptidase ErfK/SrfK